MFMHNKGQKHMNLIEAEYIKKRRQEYTEELYQKELNDPDNHDSVITHLEPDILESDVKQALGSITTRTKLLEVMEFQLIWIPAISNPKRLLRKCCTQYASKF